MHIWDVKSLFLYARLLTGRIMVWWCLGVSQFSALFSCMLWRIALKLCMSLSYEHSINVEYRQFPSFCWVLPLLELRILEIHSFPHFSLTCFDILSWFFHMTLFHCTTDQVWVSQFASNVVGVMPLLELRILKTHSFTHFSLTCFDILSWNYYIRSYAPLELKFCIRLCITVLQINFDCGEFA